MHMNDDRGEVLCNQNILSLCIKYSVSTEPSNYMQNILWWMELYFYNMEQQK